VTTIEALCNEALDAIGYRRYIGNIYEGSAAARIALNAWETTRDGLLARAEPDWARQDAPLELLASAPSITGAFANYDLEPWSDQYPPLPWLYAYRLPDDCIKTLLVKRRPFTVPVFMPRYVPYLCRNTDTLFCNITDAILVYVRRALDPTAWEVAFQGAMVAALAEHFRAQLAPQQQAAQGAQRTANADAAG
jgi:hypothetical protein